MSFQDRQPIAFLEHLMGEVAVHNPDPVRQCMTLFGALQSEALSQSASVAAIREIGKELA
nr:Scr1 family TA system antitoxin-like transcriptional regulator [Streptomonospora litoralis]